MYLSAVSTYQIIKPTLFPDPVPTALTCRKGALELYGSLRSARLNALGHDKSEREALTEFRNSLLPVWRQEPAIRRICIKDGDKQALAALRTLERLRYAEERAVRHSSNDLSHLRAKTPALVSALAPLKEKTEH